MGPGMALALAASVMGRTCEVVKEGDGREDVVGDVFGELVFPGSLQGGGSETEELLRENTLGDFPETVRIENSVVGAMLRAEPYAEATDSGFDGGGEVNLADGGAAVLADARDGDALVGGEAPYPRTISKDGDDFAGH